MTLKIWKSIPFADHNPILWSLTLRKELHTVWCMNMDLWRDETFSKQAAVHIKKLNFLNNLNHGTQMQIIWDMGKASFQGFVINYMARKNKSHKETTNESLLT